MICSDVEERLWDFADPRAAPEELRCHLGTCSSCAGVVETIVRVRQVLREESTQALNLASGVIARLSRPRSQRLGMWARCAASLLLGVLLTFVLRPVPAPQRPVPEPLRLTPLQELIGRIDNTPEFESLFLDALNSALRRHSELAVRPTVRMHEEDWP